MSSSLTGSPNYFNFSVDPMEPNRVWFFSRSVLKHTGDLIFGPQVIKPTGKTIVSPPQVLSMSFNEDGQCYKFTGKKVAMSTILFFEIRIKIIPRNPHIFLRTMISGEI